MLRKIPIAGNQNGQEKERVTPASWPKPKKNVLTIQFQSVAEKDMLVGRHAVPDQVEGVKGRWERRVRLERVAKGEERKGQATGQKTYLGRGDIEKKNNKRSREETQI